MGFEAFSVILSPVDAEEDALTTGHLVSQMKRRWRSVQTDSLELAERADARSRNKVHLVRRTTAGLIQVALWRDKSSCALRIELRFAYCNPRSVYGPFCEMTAWLMQKYKMRCHIVPDLAPEQQGISDDFERPEMAAELLTPSMDYNRSLWQLDAGTEATAALRPGDAIAKFITPRLLDVSP